MTAALCRLAAFLVACAGAARAAKAEDAVALVERWAPGVQHHVSTRVKLSGELLVPVDKDKPPKKVAMHGESAIEYDERLLPGDEKAGVQKSLRLYRQMDFQRTVGDRPQEMSLRPAVRKIVVLRGGRVKNSFSPDGPLTWGEIDLLRTDLFIPALAGLLPAGPVKPGDIWKATDAAALELTDLEKVEEGALQCRLEAVTILAGRKVAHVRLWGTLSGVNEDGPNRQVLTGTLYFDLAGGFTSYLSVKGEHYLLDKDGKTAGKVEGLFVMTRPPDAGVRELSDDALRGVGLEPSPDNTLLLYDNAELGLKFLYPRRWHVGRVNGPQLTLDDSAGNGILITVDPPKRVPTAEQFVRETTGFLTEQKAKFLSFDRPNRLRDGPAELDRFAFGIEIAGQKVLMDYFVARQANGGATVAARLQERDQKTLRPEVERIARSLGVTREPASR